MHGKPLFWVTDNFSVNNIMREEEKRIEMVDAYYVFHASQTCQSSTQDLWICMANLCPSALRLDSCLTQDQLFL